MTCMCTHETEETGVKKYYLINISKKMNNFINFLNDELFNGKRYAGVWLGSFSLKSINKQ